MTDSPEDYLHLQAPPLEMLSLWGSVNFCWAMLDVIITGAFCTIMDMDVVELGITIGRLDQEAKLARMIKILNHRKDHERAALLKSYLSELNPMKEHRNAITHGYYIGTTARGEMCFVLMADFRVGEGQPSANKMIVLTADDCGKEGLRLHEITLDLHKRFGGKRMLELLSLPARV
jgi:hypothetical protein